MKKFYNLRAWMQTINDIPMTVLKEFLKELIFQKKKRGKNDHITQKS